MEIAYRLAPEPLVTRLVRCAVSHKTISNARRRPIFAGMARAAVMMALMNGLASVLAVESMEPSSSLLGGDSMLSESMGTEAPVDGVPLETAPMVAMDAYGSDFGEPTAAVPTVRPVNWISGPYL